MKKTLINRAIQRCSTIIERLEKRYAEERPKNALVGSDVIRVELEMYEYAVKVLRRKLNE